MRRVRNWPHSMVERPSSSDIVCFLRAVESGSVVASHEWAEDVMQDTGGDFLLIHVCPRRLISHRARLTKLSSSTCRALISTPTCEGHLQIPHANTVLTAQFRHGLDAQIISIQPHPERPSVTLTTGEVVSADVIVGFIRTWAPSSR